MRVNQPVARHLITIRLRRPSSGSQAQANVKFTTQTCASMLVRTMHITTIAAGA